MKYFFIYSFIFFCLASCKQQVNKATIKESDIEVTEKLNENSTIHTEQIDYKALILKDSTYRSLSFDFPVGKPNANGYYNAQKFQENDHLGDDWNGIGGGNSDLGDPIYAIANGYISEAKDYESGWGNVIRIVHLYKDKLYESLYAHCDSILIEPHQFVKKGEQIATIGNCNGAYYAHLHLEIRDSIEMDIGGGYSTNTTGYLNPTTFIKQNRK